MATAIIDGTQATCNLKSPNSDTVNRISGERRTRGLRTDMHAMLINELQACPPLKNCTQRKLIAPPPLTRTPYEEILAQVRTGSISLRKGRYEEGRYFFLSYIIYIYSL